MKSFFVYHKFVGTSRCNRVCAYFDAAVLVVNKECAALRTISQRRIDKFSRARARDAGAAGVGIRPCGAISLHHTLVSSSETFVTISCHCVRRTTPSAVLIVEVATRDAKFI